MDRKTIAILALSFLLLLMWGPLVQRMFPPKKVPMVAGTNTLATATNRLAAGTNATVAAPMATAAVTPAPAAVIRPGEPEQLTVLDSEMARYTFTTHGGGLREVELKSYPETVARNRKQALASSNFVTLNTRAPVAAMTLTGDSSLLGDGLYQVAKTERGVRAEKTLSSGLQIVKDFEPGSNHVITVKVRLENRSTAPLALPAQEWVMGTATPLNLQDDGRLMGVYWHDGTKSDHVDEPWFANRTLGCLPGTPRSLYESPSASTNVHWAAVHNQFFTLAVVASSNAYPQGVLVRQVDMPEPTAEDIAADPKAVRKPKGYQASMVQAATQLAPGQVIEQDYTLYAGPKEYRTLDALGRQLGQDLEVVMSFGGFFGWFAKLLLLSMNGLHSWGINYGLTIIIITVIIKLLFWPLTNASTKSMKRMAALQPQMKELQEKYKEDPQKMNKKLMEFMKEHKVSPLGGCLPMLLQIPVFFGFYTMLQSAIELRGASFLWAADLSKSDTIWTIPGLNFPLNPMPLLMGVTMLWQARMTPPSPGMDPMQQKIMKYMPLMFIFILYNFSAGLTLYWTVQNLLSIAQMKVTKATDPVAKPEPPAPGRGKPVSPRRKS